MLFLLVNGLCQIVSYCTTVKEPSILTSHCMYILLSLCAADIDINKCNWMFISCHKKGKPTYSALMYNIYMIYNDITKEKL